LGLGFNGAITEENVDRMENFFRSRGAGPTVDVCPFADFSLVETLSQRGYKISEFANVMVRGIAAGVQVPEISGRLPRSGGQIARKRSFTPILWFADSSDATR
jgi:hypothetical protein